MFGEDNIAVYTEIASRYDWEARNLEYVVPKVATEHFAKHLKKNNKWVDSDPFLLDVAAGTGKNAIHLANDHQMRNIEAMDQTEAMLNEARRRELYREYYIANANEEWPFPLNKYDGTICTGGLAYNQIKPSPAIRSLVRVTKPGGIVVFTIQSSNQDYIDEVKKLTKEGLAEVVESNQFVGIKTMSSVHIRCM